MIGVALGLAGAAMPLALDCTSAPGRSLVRVVSRFPVERRMAFTLVMRKTGGSAVRQAGWLEAGAPPAVLAQSSVDRSAAWTVDLYADGAQPIARCTLEPE